MESRQSLINTDWSINPHKEFTFPRGKNKGKRLMIIGTDSNGEVYNSIDRVKNIENGKVTLLERIKLKELNPYVLY